MTTTTELCRTLGLILSLTLAPAAWAQDAPAEAAAATDVAQVDVPDAGDPAAAPETAAAELETIPVPDEAAPSGGWLEHFDASFGGFLRTESAYSLDSKANPANQFGNLFNQRSIPRQAYTPPALGGGNWGDTPLATASDQSAPGLRPLPTQDNEFNYMVVRGEFEANLKFTPDLTFIGRVRALYGPGDFYEEFDGNSLDADRGGIAGGDPALYQAAPNYFEYRVDGNERPNPLEFAGPDYLVYFPTLLLEYNYGPLTARFGNQQIAWGQALFFRVFDVVDGLDLRRHLVLDYAQEEFADERTPALGARIAWQFSEEWLADAFVQKFQPSVYPNPNTPYNFIPVAFTVHDLYAQGGYDEKLNYGLRFKGNYGQWGFQAAAVQRYNPDGVFRWTRSGVNRPLPGGSACSTAACQTNAAYENDLPSTRMYDNTGDALAETAFEVAPGGVYSANEWFNYAGQVRLHGIDGLNASIAEFPAAQDLYASVAGSYDEATAELNTFFIASGGSLRGHIAREYFQEDVYALGASYVVEGEPGGIFDQLIINLEHSLTKGRTFTNISLSRNYTVEDANITALVMEKYYRFTQAFPATYFVFQYMHRDVDDLFGRLLTGYGGSETQAAQGVDGGANYYVLAFQQPFPQDIWRAGFAMLYDPRGSLLVQPGLRWKQSTAFTVESFYTYIDGALGDANPNDTLLSTIDYADEFTLRLTYQF